MEIKSNSSKWIKTKGIKYENFYWQNGYGAFSIGYERVDRVSTYIMNQRAHQSKVKFQTEMRTTFKSNPLHHSHSTILVGCIEKTKRY